MKALAQNKILILVVLAVFCSNCIPAGLYANIASNDNLRPTAVSDKKKDGGKDRLIQDMRKKEIPEGALNTMSLLIELDYVMRMLKVGDHKRAIQILLTSSSSTEFINKMMEYSGRDLESVENAMNSIDIFKPLVADARYRRTKVFDPAEFRSKTLDCGVDLNGYTKKGRQSDVPGGAMSDYLRFMRQAAGDVQMIFRDDQDVFLGRFLGMAAENTGEAPDLMDIITKLDSYLDGMKDADKVKKVKYLITSGIGANEMYSHLRARLVNEYMEKNGIPFRWIVVNNPAHELLIPEDADDENTVIFEMSRSGSTDETKKFMLYTLSRFKHRIAAANKGALNDIGRKLAGEDADAEVMIFDDIPEDIGGRQMNRKTLMVYAPLYLALRLGLKDKDMAAGTLKEYSRASYDSNTILSYGLGDASLAVEGAEFIFRHRESGRNNLAVAYDEELRALFKELEQLNNEGANKVTADGINNNLVIGYSLDKNPDIYKQVFADAGDRQIGIFLLNKNAENYGEKVEYINSLRDKGVPVIAIALDLKKVKKGDEDSIVTLKDNLAVAERASYLIQDMIVYFTYLTKQDANSNPNVKMVRAITATNFESLKVKKAYKGEVNPVVSFAEIAAGLAEKGANDKRTLAGTIDVVKGKGGLPDTLITRKTTEEIGQGEFGSFVEKCAALEQALGMKEGSVGAVLGEALSMEVFEADLGEAGGAGVPNIDAAFTKAGFENPGQREQRLAGKQERGLYKQIVLNPDDGDVNVSVAVNEKSNWSPQGETIEQKIADYIVDMWSKDILYMPLSYMEVDMNNDNIADIVRMITGRFSQWGITCPMLAYPNAAHTGAEGVFTHSGRSFNIAIAYTQAYGGRIGNAVIEEGKFEDGKKWEITIDNATYVFGIGNVSRGAFAGGRTILLTMPNADSLPQVKEILAEAFDIAQAGIKERFYSEPAVPAGLSNMVRSLNPGVSAEQLREEWKKFNQYNSLVFSRTGGDALESFIGYLVDRKLLDTGKQKAVVFSEEDSRLPGFYPALAALRELETVKVTEGGGKGKPVIVAAVYGKNAENIKALAGNDGLITAEDLPALKKGLADLGITENDTAAVVASPEEISEAHDGMQKIISGEIFTLAAGEALRALFARGEYKQPVDDAFGSLWNTFVDTKIVPVDAEETGALYQEMVTRPVGRSEALDLTKLPAMEKTMRSDLIGAQTEINKITDMLTGTGA